MWSEIDRLSGEQGITVLLTTHYLEEADQLASQLAIVDRGQIVGEGTPDELKRELRGDAIQVDLAGDYNGAASAALDQLAGVGEVTIDGRALRAASRTAAAQSPSCCRRSRHTASPSPRSGSRGPRWMTCTCDLPAAHATRPKPRRRR